MFLTKIINFWLRAEFDNLCFAWCRFGETRIRWQIAIRIQALSLVWLPLLVDFVSSLLEHIKPF